MNTEFEITLAAQGLKVCQLLQPNAKHSVYFSLALFCLFISIVLSLWDVLISSVLPVKEGVKEYACDK